MKGGSNLWSEKGVRNLKASESLSVLQVLGVEEIAMCLDGCRDDQGVVPGQPTLPLEMQCLDIQRMGRMQAEQRTEDRAQVLFGVRCLHRMGESPERDVEEFLYDLIANDALLRGQGLADELRGFPGFHRGALVERVNKDVCVQEESIAHSIHPG